MKNEWKNYTEIKKATGFSKRITITDYANLPENQNDNTIVSGLVKKVTVEIAYKDEKEIQTVALSTVLVNQ